MKKAYTILYFISVCAIISLQLFILRAERPSIYDASAQEGFCQLEAQSFHVIEDPAAPAGITEEYSYTLKDIPPTNGVILFFYTHQEVTVSLGTETVYSLTANPDNHFSKGVGFGVIRIPVTPAEEGKQVTITISPIYRSGIGQELTVYLGSYQRITAAILKKDIPILFICNLCLLVGFTVLLTSLYKLIVKKFNFEIVCLGLISLSAGLWKLMDTETAALLMRNSLFTSSLSILSIPIIILSIIYYFSYQFSQGLRKPLIMSGYICSFFSMVILILQITGVADIRQTLFISHLLIVYLVVIGIISLYREIRMGVMTAKLKALCICTSLCIIGGITDIIIYYVQHHLGQTFVGILAFFICIVYLCVLSLIEAISLMKQGQTAKHYKKIALHDELTGLHSRAYFKQYIGDGSHNTPSCCLIMFDVNNLKQCNDTLGHAQGDILLCNAAKLIHDAFHSIGKCVRLSGDEFCVIIEQNSEERLTEALDHFMQAIQLFNANHPGAYPVQIAFGYACFDAAFDLDLNDTLKRADKKMYEMKHLMKLSNY